MLLVCSAKTPSGSFVTYCFCIGLRLLPYSRSGGEHSGRELYVIDLRVLIGRFNLALKIQFHESSVFSFPVYSICRCHSLGIRYGSYFRLIQFADSCSVVIATPYITTKVIAIQLLVARPILTVELRVVYSLVKSGLVRCYLICRLLPHNICLVRVIFIWRGRCTR